ncbi:unnamed protein product [Heterobilharzia americana]|nr:unnamed protein product [Heterobilharzia americana]
MNVASFLVFLSLSILSMKGLVMPEAGSIDYQTKRWTDFKRAPRWPDYPFTINPEFKHRELYEQRPNLNDLLV